MQTYLKEIKPNCKYKRYPESENEFELCVLCGKQTDVRRDTNIDFRTNYIEGCGQLCRECSALIYKQTLIPKKISEKTTSHCFHGSLWTEGRYHESK